MPEDRRVHQLRLTAADVDAVRAMQPRLADALRCASLPDAGGRLLLVRRLALGRLNPRASAQQIARHLEQGLATAGWAFVDGASPAAAQAPAVAFASVAQARLQLSAALLQGERPSGWHWPLAVPEYRAELPVAENLVRLASALAAAPDAPAALPAWVALAARQGHLAALAAAVPVDLGEALVRAAGGPRGAPTAPVAQAGAAAAPPSAPPGAAEHATATPGRPRWLTALLELAGVGAATAPVTLPPPAAGPVQHRRGSASPAPGVVRVAGLPPPRPAPPGSPGRAPPGAGSTAARAPSRAPSEHPAHEPGPTRPPWDVPAHAASTAHRRPAHRPSLPAPGEPTRLGGLLFLLPVLDRLGLDDWAADRGAAHDLPLRILHAAARRLRAEAGDPLLAALGTPADEAGAFARAAPPVWHHALLRPPRGRPADLPAALCIAADAEAQAEVWLAALRRWLRRAAHIGLASLVCRPARVAAGPTHVDLHFALDAADLRVRRAGLDADPGWHAGLRRIVAFHYGRSGAP